MLAEAQLNPFLNLIMLLSGSPEIQKFAHLNPIPAVSFENSPFKSLLHDGF